VCLALFVDFLRERAMVSSISNLLRAFHSTVPPDL
jgi:hypothetical protein